MFFEIQIVVKQIGHVYQAPWVVLIKLLVAWTHWISSDKTSHYIRSILGGLLYLKNELSNALESSYIFGGVRLVQLLVREYLWCRSRQEKSISKRIIFWKASAAFRCISCTNRLAAHARFGQMRIIYFCFSTSSTYKPILVLTDFPFLRCNRLLLRSSFSNFNLPLSGFVAGGSHDPILLLLDIYHIFLVIFNKIHVFRAQIWPLLLKLVSLVPFQNLIPVIFCGALSTAYII